MVLCSMCFIINRKLFISFNFGCQYLSYHSTEIARKNKYADSCRQDNRV